MTEYKKVIARPNKLSFANNKGQKCTALVIKGQSEIFTDGTILKNGIKNGFRFFRRSKVKTLFIY